MSNWTKGPWHVSRGNGVDTNQDKQVCRAPIGYERTIVGRNWEANARLIASAPDLHEALSAMVDLIEEKHYSGGLTQAGIDAVNQARAALARVRGEIE
jgi:hypothetical protein